MAHAFDLWGWYAGGAPDGEPRSTQLVPPTLSTDETVGAPRANWTGEAWAVRPYVAPPADETPPPDEVETYKAHAVLIRAGWMSAVKAAIAAIEDETERELAEVMFYRRPTIRRIGELTQQIQNAAGISDELRDELFRQALTV